MSFAVTDSDFQPRVEIEDQAWSTLEAVSPFSLLHWLFRGEKMVSKLLTATLRAVNS